MTAITSVKGRGHPELIIQLQFNILKLFHCWSHSFQPPFHFFSLSHCSASVQCYYFFSITLGFSSIILQMPLKFFSFFLSLPNRSWVVKQVCAFLFFFLSFSVFFFFSLIALHRFIWGEKKWLNYLLKREWMTEQSMACNCYSDMFHPTVEMS